MNSVDNQRLTSKNTKTTGKKPAKPISSHSILATATEMNNKSNMTTKPQHLHIFRKSAAGLPLKTVNYFQDENQPAIACIPEK
jgi:hypothetical protein